MKSIYASKLYRSSNRKEKIKAAIVSAANKGLVQQLADSLDEQYQTKELLDPETELEKQEAEGALPESFSPGDDASSFNPSTDLVNYPSGGGGSADGMFFADGGEEGSDEMMEGEVAEDETAEFSEDAEVSTDEEITESTRINASTCLDTSNLNILKDGLNSVQDVAGVTRIVVKENELWIYYNDDTNLNNIMTEVIDYVIQRCPDVDFNRLARSDNAIVFEQIESTSKVEESA